MKNLAFLLSMILFSLANMHCTGGASDGFTLSGTIEGAGGLQVYLDKVGINPTSANTVIGKTDADANGGYEMVMPASLEAGIYRVRVGEQRVNLVLDGSENDVELNGQLAGLNSFQYTVAGSPHSLTYQETIKKLVAKQMTVADVQTFVNTTPNPITGMIVAVQAIGNNNQPALMEVYRSAQKRMKASYPGSALTNDYDAFLAELQKVQTGGGDGFQFVEEAQRQPAPDIKLPSPNGKEYALSDLKGKVVLLDFWASWCGPCRRENPNVVRIYDQYKDKGFTVFSVSLDGIDPRQLGRMTDQKQIAEAQNSQKQRWIDAIKQDGLKWDYHVSELRKWDSPAAQQYGVSSIPRTFMIDKEGRIAAVNLRGPDIEAALLKLL